MAAYHQGLRPKKSKDDWYKEQKRRNSGPDYGCDMNPAVRAPDYRWQQPMLIMCFLWPQGGRAIQLRDELYERQRAMVRTSPCAACLQAGSAADCEGSTGKRVGSV